MRHIFTAVFQASELNVPSFYLAQLPNAGHGRLVAKGFYITHNNTPQSVGLLWASDRPDAEIST